MAEKWSELTPAEKREKRFQRWLSGEGINFINSEAKDLYKIRVTRLIDAIQLKEPDRVPVSSNGGYIPARYSGYTTKDMMYDPDKLTKAWEKYLNDFEFDTLPAAGVRCGRALDILQPKTTKWPGGGLPDNASPQHAEVELLRADEWDDLEKDASDFQIRRYLPRSYGAAEAFEKLPRLSAVAGGFGVFSDPDVLAAFKALGDAGKENMKWQQVTGAINRKGLESGLPRFAGMGGGAPFDGIGARFRGTKGLILDMFRQPERLIAYMEKSVPNTIRQGVAGANASGVPVLFMPLHRGADGFMTEGQFLRFYWPYLKKVIMGYVEEGLVPRLFAEGGYNSRLEIISELPKGSVIWHFDQTDMKRVKKALGDKVCIMGNVPTSLLCSATVEEVKAHCKDLIETAGRGGGYILSPGATADNAIPENIAAMMAAAKEYGAYR